jgi:hypothetical protein
MQRWSAAELADAIHRGLKKQADLEDAAQEVYGFDARDELGLHPILQTALLDDGYGVWPEQRYPGDWAKRKRSEGKRCDLVITPQGKPIRDPQVKQTLFDTAPATDASAAYWLEVKTVAQFENGGPFRRYSAELMQPVTQDVKKLWNDPIIKHAGLLLILFTADPEIAEHDLKAWHDRCLKRGYPAQPPATRHLKITDRIGNTTATTALFPIRGG